MEVEKAPKISIIVPCYNAKNTLARCMDSLLSQTIGQENLEIILVDDFSTDGTREDVIAYEQQYECVRAILNASNQKQGFTRNRGLDIATGEYIGFTDADDWVEKDAFAYMMEKCDRYNCDVAIMGSYYDSGENTENENFEPDKAEYHEELITIDTPAKRGDMIASGSLRIGTCNAVFRREMISNNQIRFPEGVLFSEDIFWGFIVKLYCCRIYTTSRRFYHYIIDDNSDYDVLRKKDWLMYHMKMNSLLWDEIQLRNIAADCLQAVEFEYIMNYYVLAMKVLSLGYDPFPCESFREICQDIRNKIPAWRDNRYLKTHVTDFQGIQLGFIGMQLSDEEIRQVAQITKEYYL